MPQVVKSPDAFRTISEVSDALSLEPHVLRFWETKFAQVRPVKRSGGRRYYRTDDVALLAGIKFLLREQGMTIKGAQRLLREKGVRYVSGLAPDAMSTDDFYGVAPQPMPAAEIVPLASRRTPVRSSTVDVAGSVPDSSADPLDEAKIEQGAEGVPLEQGGAAFDDGDRATPVDAEERANSEASEGPAAKRTAGRPIPLPRVLLEDVADDARLKVPPRRPRIDPDLVRRNRGAVRRHLAALVALRDRMDRPTVGGEG